MDGWKMHLLVRKVNQVKQYWGLEQGFPLREVGKNSVA
jgi:hypothetical protein